MNAKFNNKKIMMKKVFIQKSLKLLKWLQNKMIPLKKQYDKYSNSRYGRLLRMKSYWVYPMLFLPTWCALWMASSSTINNISLALLFAIGSFLMRSVGCIINDIVDRKIDQQVIRTQNRPIASGEVSVFEGIKLIMILLILGVIILLSLPNRVLFIGGFAIIMITLYPFSKRFTHVPQLILGLTFNLGVLIAWLSVSYEHIFQMIMLYIGFAVFTFAYDTIYACQDLQDDLAAGIQSFPVLLTKKGENIQNAVWQLYKVSGMCIAIAGLGMNMNFSFFLALAIALYLLYNQLERCDINDANSCAKHFAASNIYLFILFLGTVFGN